ncbi:MAG: AAA family ATPase [Kiritimatiellaeota bacterium]|nr:AAA family ATPase [Kiritimatiellota bacterium]
MDLFDHNRERLTTKEQPLAARMRPRTLDEFVGQDHILAPGRLLRRAIQADRLSSVIFYGPPGTGKTTLAMVIANTTRSHFEILNAVLAGVADVRRVTEDAKRRRGEQGQRTILFVDEVHRWNKAQQDALLPWVENGTILLVGATTENPYFTVNRALVSRSRIFQLKPLEPSALRAIARAALNDPERGYAKLRVELAEDALEHLVDVANGDARALLNALELAVETTPPRETDGVVRIDLAVAEESIQRRAVLYDKEGDYHFDTISAFIKSLRGSDPDAALYWMAKMVYAGEDPRFIFRRMIIFAGEDVGLADPNAMVVVTAAAEAFDRVGMPEGRYHLGFAALYLATAPKSNSVMAFFDALATVENEQDSEVPSHLRDASRDRKGFGHGEGYLYPHAYRDHWVAQQYLPEALQGKLFYQPGRLGYEAGVADALARRREAQLAAVLEADRGAPPEILTSGPTDRDLEQWLARTISGVGEQLGELRDRIFQAVPPGRHRLILDLAAQTGLLTWEAVRRTPEGGVWCRVPDRRAADVLEAQARQHGLELQAPHLLVCSLSRLPKQLEVEGHADVRFDAVIGRNALVMEPDKTHVFRILFALLRPDGVLSLAEVTPRHGQRLYRLIEPGTLDADLFARLARAEEAVYTATEDPMVNWDETDLANAAEQAGFAGLECRTEERTIQKLIAPERVEQWFGGQGAKGRPTYAERLAAELSPDEVARVHAVYRRQLAGRTVPWKSVVTYLKAVRPGTE